MPDLSLLFDAETQPELAKDHEWWRIYERSIPESEREPREVVFKAMERGVGKAFRARLDGRTAGMASIHLTHHPEAVFLTFLAVDPAVRGRGLGGRLFEHAFSAGCDALRARGAEPLGMVWEVDDPALAADEAERVVRDKRIGFYAEHGGVVLDQPYILPPLRPGASPQPMRLMFRPADGGPLPGAAQAVGLVWALYFEKYHAINGIDRTLLQRLLQGAGAA